MEDGVASAARYWVRILLAFVLAPGGNCNGCWPEGLGFSQCCEHRTLQQSVCWKDDKTFHYSRCCILGADDTQRCAALARTNFPGLTDVAKFKSDALLISHCCMRTQEAVDCWPHPDERAHCCLQGLPPLLGTGVPDWVKDHVDEDVRRALDDAPVGDNCEESSEEEYEDNDNIVQYEIQDGQLTVHSPWGPLGGYDQFNSALSIAIESLLEHFKAPIVNATLDVYDGYYHYTLDEKKSECRRTSPLLVNARLKSASRGTVLLPQWYFVIDWNRYIFDFVTRAHQQYPSFRSLDDVLFWRGATTRTRQVVVNGNWWASPRFILVNLSLAHPDLIDARFSELKGYLTQKFEDAIYRLGMLDEDTNLFILLQFKYVIHIEGAQESKSLYWQLLAPGVLFMPASPIESWVSRMLKPWVHYIPVREDLRDLVEKVRWAKANDDECQDISQAATQLAIERLNQQSAMAYLSYLLQVTSERAARQAQALKTEMRSSRATRRLEEPPTAYTSDSVSGDDATTSVTCPQGWLQKCGTLPANSGDGAYMSANGRTCTAVANPQDEIRAKALCGSRAAIAVESSKIFLDQQVIEVSCTQGVATLCTCHSLWGLHICNNLAAFPPSSNICRMSISKSPGRRRNTEYGAGAKLYALCHVGHETADLPSTETRTTTMALAQTKSSSAVWCPAVSEGALQRVETPANESGKVLVGVICSTRSERLTYRNFKENVLDVLAADLALAVSHRGGAPASNSVDESPLRRWATWVFDLPDVSQNDHYVIAADVAMMCNGQVFDPPLLAQEAPGAWLGGFAASGQVGAGGILMAYRWLLLAGLKHVGALGNYRTLVLTRSDFFYLAPHPPVPALRPTEIMVPEGLDNGGIVDKHQVMSMTAAVQLLGMLEFVTRQSATVASALHQRHNRTYWNFQHAMKAYMEWSGVQRVARFPRVMFTVVDEKDKMPHASDKGSAQSTASIDAGVWVKSGAEYYCARSGERWFAEERGSTWDGWQPQFWPVTATHQPRCELDSAALGL